MDNSRILLIDDDERSIEAVRKALSGYRVELEVWREPNAAFARAQQARPRAVVLTVELTAQKQGYTLCRRLKKSPETQGIPVLLLSAGDPYFEDHRKLAFRADEYLLKPFGARALVAKLEAIAGSIERRDPGFTAEIIEVEDEQELPQPEITVVASEGFEEVGQEDILVAEEVEVLEVLELEAAPAASASAHLSEAEEDSNAFDAMLDSLEFKEAPRVSVVNRASVAASPAIAPSAPTAGVSAAVSAQNDEDAQRRERQILDLKERLVLVERRTDAEVEARRGLESALAAAKQRLAGYEGATSLSGQALAEELAAREQELQEKGAQLERFSTDMAQRLEQAESTFGERLAAAREDYERQATELRQSGQRDRGLVEAALHARLREAEAARDAAVEAGEKAAAAERAHLADELETLRTQLAELERERREQEIAFSERLAAAVDEARRPLEEELGLAAERNAHEVGGARRTFESELATARAAAEEAARRSAPLAARVQELEQTAFAMMQRSSHLEADLQQANGAVVAARAARAAPEAMLEARARAAESLRSTLSARDAELESTRAQVAASLAARASADALAQELRAQVAEQAQQTAEQAASTLAVQEASLREVRAEAATAIQQAQALSASQVAQARAELAAGLQAAQADAAARLAAATTEADTRLAAATSEGDTQLREAQARTRSVEAQLLQEQALLRETLAQSDAEARATRAELEAVARASLSELQGRADVALAEGAQARQALASVRAELTAAQEQSILDARERVRLDADARAALQRASTAETDHARMKAELAAWDALIAEVKQAAGEQDATIAKLRAEATRALEGATAAQTAAESARAELAGLRAELEAQGLETTRVREEHARTVSSLETEAATVRQLRDEVVAAEAHAQKAAVLASQTEELRQQLAGLEQRLALGEAERLKLEQRLQFESQRNGRLRDSVNALTQVLHEKSES